MVRRNALIEKFREDHPVVSGWLSIASTYSAEIVARQGFDCVNVDLQHGMIGIESAIGMLQAISSTDAVPLARVGANDPAMIMKLLDAGAYGIICPSISTSADARAFVSACRYPPAGTRSFGPARGLLYGGADYFEEANAEVLAIGMIESREGIKNLESIVEVDGLDCLFIGPNDLSLSLGKAPEAESEDPVVVDAIAYIRRVARRAGKPVGIFCSGPSAAAGRIREGFALVVPGSDAGLLSKSARAAFRASRD